MSENISKKDEIRLPFEQEDFDVGVWSYDHKAGLFITLIVYLLIAIGFVTARISVITSKPQNTIVVDIEQLEQLEQIKEDLEEQIKEKQAVAEQIEDVQNTTSNEAMPEEVEEEAMPENDEFRELMEEIERTQQDMAANEQLLREGLAEAARRPEKPKTQVEKKPESERRDNKKKGNVTVSYAVVNPIRHAQHLSVPSYMCENGGKVTLNIRVNRNGYVIEAEVHRSTGDICIEQAAISAAKASRFNFSDIGPEEQKGRISYIFLSQ